MRILIIISALLLSACNSTQGLSVFSLSESEAETVLAQQLPKLSERMSLMGLPVQFDVNEMRVEIGPDNRDVVALSVDSSAEVNAFAFNYPVRLGLQIEGSPFYDSEKKAIFLRNLKLLNSSIDAAGFKGNLGVLNGEALRLINAFLAVNPVYKLDTSDPTMAVLSRLPLNLEVVEGAIKLVPRL